MNSTNWTVFAQMLIGAVGAFNPAVAATLGMVLNGISTLQADSAADQALFQQWVAFCNTMIAHGGDPTPDEHAAARAFADQVHASNQP